MEQRTPEKEHILTMDIGNSTFSMAVAVEGELLNIISFSSSSKIALPDVLSSIEEVCLNVGGLSSISGCVISCVVPTLGQLAKEACRMSFGFEPVIVNSASPLGIEVHTDDPSEVGADLLCDAVAAYALYGEYCLVADLGTATKLILVGEKGAFEGVSIGVGLGMAKKALYRDTAALPEVDLVPPKSVIGKNTADSIISALTYGKVEEVRGMAERVEQELGRKLTLVLTGGYANLLRTLLPEFAFAPELVLRGAAIVYANERDER